MYHIAGVFGHCISQFITGPDGMSENMLITLVTRASNHKVEYINIFNKLVQMPGFRCNR